MNPLFGFPKGAVNRTPQYGVCISGVANAYRVSERDGFVPVPEALYDGFTARIKVDVTNTGATTLQLGALTATAVRTVAGKALSGGEWKAGQIVEVIYDGTNGWWQFESGSAAPTQARAWVKFNGVPTGKTITNAPTGNVLTITGHLLTAATTLANVTRVSVRNTGGAVHAGLAENTQYYFHYLTANSGTLHTTAQGGLDGTSNIVTISGSGTGTNTMYYVTVNDSYGVDGVVIGSNLSGDYIVTWTTAFATAHYAVFGFGNTTGDGTLPTVHVSFSDFAEAGRKRIRTQLAGTPSNLTEVHVLAFGNI